VSRTYHFGEKGGTSRNQFGSILSSVKLNKDDIDWTTQDLSYLDQDSFDEQYGKLVAKSTLVRTVQEAQASVRMRDTRLEYGGIVQFKAMANELGIMNDEKASVPRTAYKGVVEIRPSGDHFLFLTPPLNELKNSLPYAQG
jgi:alpha-1,3-mannosyl-glycoprotein beta-1,2-N-acetylglucosaminyltransferase